MSVRGGSGRGVGWDGVGEEPQAYHNNHNNQQWQEWGNTTALPPYSWECKVIESHSLASLAFFLKSEK